MRYRYARIEMIEVIPDAGEDIPAEILRPMPVQPAAGASVSEGSDVMPMLLGAVAVGALWWHHRGGTAKRGRARARR